MDAIPKSLLSDHTDDEGTITVNIKLILAHMEETYDKICPKDISNIMKTFTAEFDGTTTLFMYFDWQQGCRKLLRTTKEPILVATMIRTSLGNFQRLPYMSKACEENGRSLNKSKKKMTAPPPGKNSRNFSIKSFLAMTTNMKPSRK